MVGEQYVDIVYIDDDGIEVHATEHAPLIASLEEWLEWWDARPDTHPPLIDES